MGINNLNPRRVVWFSPNEPSNKYDIWLSRNAHLDENGEPTTDSNSQRNCDYIFKIYDCGKWNPIVGFNSTAANKINIVTGIPYQYTIDGESYTSNGKLEFDLPLFTKDSPLELFSAGPLGDALNKFVTDAQWHTIYENHIKEIIEYYPFNLWYADYEAVGGIWADRFIQSYNDTLTANKTYLAQAKYKYQQTASDYNLYVHAKDIIGAVNTYQTENPNEQGINVGGDISIETLQGLFKNTATLEREVLINSLNHPIVKDNIWGAGSSASGNAGKLLKLKDTLQDLTEYNAQNNFIEWVSPEELFSYELPLASLGALGGIRADRHTGLLPGKFVAECKLYNPNHLAQQNSYRREALCVDVRDVKQALDDWYADNESTIWDLNIGSGYGINTIKLLTYNPNTGVTSDRYTHILDGYTNSTKQGLFCRTKYYENGNAFGNHYGLEWIGAQTIVEEGLGISSGTGYLYYNGGSFVLDPGTGGGGGGTTYYTLGIGSQAGNYVVGVPNGGTGGATKFLNGDGGWSTPPNTEYDDFEGADGTNPGLKGLVPRPLATDNNKYLKGDGTWDTPSVNVRFNINLATSFISDGDFILNNLRLSSNSTDNPINTELGEWNYYNISGGNKTTQFTFSSTHNSGNAIYIRFYTGLHSVSINTNADIIFSNETMSSSRRQFDANSSYLITIQFGIIKIEKITVNSNSFDSQN